MNNSVGQILGVYKEISRRIYDIKANPMPENSFMKPFQDMKRHELNNAILVLADFLEFYTSPNGQVDVFVNMNWQWN